MSCQTIKRQGGNLNVLLSEEKPIMIPTLRQSGEGKTMETAE